MAASVLAATQKLNQFKRESPAFWVETKVFSPFAVILTERAVSSQLTFAALDVPDLRVIP